MVNFKSQNLTYNLVFNTDAKNKHQKIKALEDSVELN